MSGKSGSTGNSTTDSGYDRSSCVSQDSQSSSSNTTQDSGKSQSGGYEGYCGGYGGNSQQTSSCPDYGGNSSNYSGGCKCFLQLSSFSVSKPSNDLFLFAVSASDSSDSSCSLQWRWRVSTFSHFYKAKWSFRHTLSLLSTWWPFAPPFKQTQFVCTRIKAENYCAKRLFLYKDSYSINGEISRGKILI